MKCEHCGSENTNMTLNITVKMDSKYFMQITKKSIQDKTTELMFANWERARLYCNDCKKSSIGL